MGEYNLTFYDRETKKRFIGKRKTSVGGPEYVLLDEEKNEVITLSSHHTFKRFRADKDNKKKKLTSYNRPLQR